MRAGSCCHQLAVPKALFTIGVALVALFAASGTSQTLPALPQTFLDTPYPSSTGTSIYVPAGTSLQSALNMAQPGDTILLEPGATYVGPITLPAKSGTGWIVVRTWAPDSSLPPPGTRITPSHASVLPKIVAQDVGPALKTAPGAHHYRFTGVEFTLDSGLVYNYGLVLLGDGSELQDSLSWVPYALVMDRVYVHGRENADVRRGIALNCASAAVIDSYISEIHEQGADSQAIAGWNGPGPFKIVNNYLEGAGENVMFGGADPSIPNLVPSDIEIRGNHFYKPRRWRIGDPSYAGKAWTVKNLFELKNARRVLVDGNLFEHNWPHAQNGFSILFTVRNQDGTAPWSVVEDVTFTHNIVRHVSSAVNILGWDNLAPSQQTKRILIKNNLFEDVSAANWGGSGRLVQMLDGSADVTIDHNTALQTGEVIMAAGLSHSGFVFRNNLVPHNTYGVAGDGTFGNPMLTLTKFFPGCSFVRNVLMGGNPADYPVDNFFPLTWNDVFFVDRAGGNYRLQPISPYKDAGTDGKDIGADFDALYAATAGTLGGIPGATDATPPAVVITAPGSGTTLANTVTISASASDNVGVAGVRFYLDGSALGTEDTTAPYEVSWDTRTAVDGAHTLTAVARDAAGNSATSAPVVVTVNNSTADTTPPTVAITAPESGATLANTVTISAGASGNVGVAGVRFYLDGSALGGEDTTAPYEVSWDTRTAADGAHTLSAVARDAAGNSATSAPILVTVNNITADTTPPAVAITAPGNGATVSGSVAISADASDNVAVAGVRFLVDGSMLGGEDTTAPYQVTWDTTTAANGSHTLTAVARDAAGNSVTSAPVTVTVANTVPDGVQGVIWTSLVHVTANGNSLQKTSGCDGCADAGAVSQQQITSGDGYVEFTAPVTSALRYIGLSNGNSGTAANDIDFSIRLQSGTAEVRENGVYRTDTGFGSGTIFRIEVRSGTVRYLKDGVLFYTSSNTPTYPLLVDTALLSLNATIDNAMIFAETTPSPSDTASPSVSISSPTDGSTVSAAIVVWAEASDNVGVAGVQFKLDDAPLGAEVTTAPYQVSWDTTAVSNGLHTLTAIARDAAGNAAASAPVVITVVNVVPDTTAPTVWITSPGNGATVWGTWTVTAQAWDDVGIVGVMFLVDGSVVGVEDTTNPYEVPWNTAAVADGAHVLTAMARDAAGNTATSAPVGVTVANSVPSGVTGEAVTWTSLVNVTATGNTLKKTSGCDGCADGGAISVQTIPSGDGHVELVASETTTQRLIGLSYGNGDTSKADIDFGLQFWPAGTVDVRERGIYRNAETSYLTGDIFRIAVQGGLVKYSKNGVVFYTSALSPTYPLLVDTSLLTLNATLTNVVIGGSQPIATGQSPFTGAPFQVPGQLEAEDYDRGGEGVAYHDKTAGNQGGYYREDDVDIISPYRNGYVVNNFETGEWLEYTINVPNSGTYRLETLVSSEFDISRFHIEVDGVDRTGSILVPNTGSWWEFQYVGKSGVSLPAGEHVLRIFAEQQYFNLDAIRILAEN